jgi:hypothetical protein
MSRPPGNDYSLLKSSSDSERPSAPAYDPRTIPQGRIGPDVLGSFGYAGDRTPDHNSARGVGAFCPRMIPGYSVGLTEEAGRARGLKHGQEFTVAGHTFRWDDTAPKHQTIRGKQITIADNYIDVYNPGHPPDGGTRVASRHRHRSPS